MQKKSFAKVLFELFYSNEYNKGELVTKIEESGLQLQAGYFIHHYFDRPWSIAYFLNTYKNTSLPVRVRNQSFKYIMETEMGPITSIRLPGDKKWQGTYLYEIQANLVEEILNGDNELLRKRAYFYSKKKGTGRFVTLFNRWPQDPSKEVRDYVKSMDYY